MTDVRALLGSGLLILPNVWDAASAVLAQAAGAKAIATTRAGLVWPLGWPDGATETSQPPEGELLAALERIARLVDVPASADCEAGFVDARG